MKFLYSVHLGITSTGTSSEYQYTLADPRLTPAQRDFYEHNGFLLIPNLVPHALLDTWRLVALISEQPTSKKIAVS